MRHVATILEKAVGHREHRVHREKQWVAVNDLLTHRVNIKNVWDPYRLCVLCDLCGLNCGF